MQACCSIILRVQDAHDEDEANRCRLHQRIQRNGMHTKGTKAEQGKPFDFEDGICRPSYKPKGGKEVGGGEGEGGDLSIIFGSGGEP